MITAYRIRAMSLADPEWTTRPVRKELVVPVGEPPANDGRPWRFEPAMLEAVVRDFAERGELAPVYWKHQEDITHGSEAAGWIDSLELRSDGLYASIRYTDEALEEIRAGKWGFRSPGFDHVEYPDGAVGMKRLYEMSLVNEPAIGGMPPIVATQQPAAEDGKAKEVTQMSDTVTTAAKKTAATFDKSGVLTAIRDTFGIPDAVSDAVLGQMIADAVAGADDVEEPMDPMAEADPPMPALATTLAAEAVRAAVTAGKLAPAHVEAAQKLAASDPKAFATLVESLPVITPDAGQVVTAGAGDRKTEPPKSYAERIRLGRNAALGAAVQ